MSRIERRRRKRKIIPIISAAAAVLLIALVVFLAVFISKKACSGKVTPDADSSSAPSSAPTEFTQEPSDIPTAEPTAEPDPTANTPDPTPSRVSPEMSYAMLAVEITNREDGEGGVLKRIAGSCAVEFVNNTDERLYSAEFDVSVLSVDSVTVNGAPARFTVENGKLVIPFLDVLEREASCDIYFTFEALTDADGFTMLSFGYDTAFGLTAVIRTEVGITLNVPETAEASDGRFTTWSFEKATVHFLEVTFTDQ